MGATSYLMRSSDIS